MSNLLFIKLNMELKIIEKECTDRVDINSQPLSYRLKLSVKDEIILLEKEYFRWGFNDSENWDKFWICKQNHVLMWVSIITRNFDEEYLNSLEHKIFKLYRENLEKNTKLLENDIKSYIKKKTIDINNQNRVTNLFDVLDRRRKIKKIKEMMK